MDTHNKYVNFIKNIPVPFLYCRIVKRQEDIEYRVEYISKGMGKVLQLEEGICDKNILDVLPVFKSKKYFKELFSNEVDCIKRYIPTLKNWINIKKQIIGDSYIILYFGKIVFDYRQIIDSFDKKEKVAYIKDEEGIYIDCSENLIPILNNNIKTTKDIFGKNDIEVWGENTGKLFRDDYREGVSSKKRFLQNLFEYEETFFMVEKYFLYDEDELLGTIGIVDNIIYSGYSNRNYNSKDLMKMIEHSIPENMFYKDVYGNYIGFNSGFLNLACMNKEELLGKNSYKISEEEALIDKIFESDKGVVENKKVVTFELNISMNDENKCIEITKRPFFDSYGSVIGIIGTARDISRRKRLEEEMDKTRMEFFANLSHELRTPINLISSSLQVIEKKEADLIESNDTLKRNLGIIKQNGNRILRLVNNVIDFTKMQSGYLDFKPEESDIIAFIEEICMSVADFASQNNIQLTFDTEIEEFSMLFDSEKLERIILNLLSNGIKYNKKDRKINIFLYVKDNVFNMKISDSGIGIPKEKIDKIFNRFEQIDNELSYRVKGSGIGLSLVKSLVELHEGSISLKSQLGIGSEFIVSLPVRSKNNIEKYNHKREISNELSKKLEIEFSDL
ncbi:PAS domain-containing sensor histidine kinase [Clostridioides difficile]|uniref:PAS domain-containing sensor histidine kinase n=1 Tax=Clostridioides difficile TaxID=1496 RepID=UPI002AB3A96E|nr:ATP-binding protein [Clostridioides difficile]MDY7834428.1 ATP-binding protein [Clostridioides difficile]MDY7871830.1 ATP-binding protein [Clostridioides difficile]